MAYIKNTWTDGVTIIGKTNLDHLETQYDEATTDLTEHNNNTSTAHGLSNLSMRRLMSTITVSSNTTNVDVTLPSLTGYKKLIIYVRAVAVASGGLLYLRFNSLSTSIYYYTTSYTSTSISVTNGISIGFLRYSSGGYLNATIEIDLAGVGLSGFVAGFSRSDVSTYNANAAKFLMSRTNLSPSSLSTLNFYDGGTTEIGAGTTFDIYGVM